MDVIALESNSGKEKCYECSEFQHSSVCTSECLTMTVKNRIISF